MRTLALLPAVSVLACAASAAGAITLDGRLDPGCTLASTQSTQTNPGPDATGGTVGFAAGSELDAAYAAVDQGVL